MSNLVFCCLLSAVPLLISCGNSDAETRRTEDRAQIDNQANKIDLLPQSMEDYCNAMGRVSELPSLSRTPEGSAYAIQRQAELRSALNAKAHEVLNKYAADWLTQDKIRGALAGEVTRMFGDEWEIVSAESDDVSARPDGDANVLKNTYRLSLRDAVFLGPDRFMTKSAVLTVTARPDCGASNGSRVSAKYYVEIKQ